MSRPRPPVGETTSRRVLLTPTREDLVDAGMLLCLGVIAVYEFHSTYAGSSYLLVAVLGLLIGIGISHLANVLRQPVIVLAAMGLAAFFLLGGAVALRNAPGAGAVPTGSTLKSLGKTAIHGWWNLLTTVPPVDGSGPLLVLPYILGLFCGLGGFALARRLRGAFWPVLAPLAVFVTVILLGTVDPSSLEAVGVGFGAVALIWTVLRGQRIRPVVSTGSARASRVTTAVVLFGLAAAGAYVFGPHVPGAGHSRVVLRRYVKPPSDVGNYPSPLAEYRHYAGDQKSPSGETTSLADKTLFTVGGTLPAGSPIRFATLDDYNGLVWAVTNDVGDGLEPNAFLKVGPTIDDPASGPTYSMTVSIQSYDDYWLPDAGAVRAVSFTDGESVQQATDFRYNLGTGTGVVPGKLSESDSYRLMVAGTAPTALSRADDLATDGYSDAGSFLHDTTTKLAGTGGNLATQVLRIAHTLKTTGRYTHGGTGSGFEYYLPGQSVGRLTKFVKGVIPGEPFVGDDEQYAAAYALMIEQLGVPARVVVGVAALPASRTVHGSDVDAWIEVQASSGRWLTIPTSEFLDKNNEPDKKQLQQKHKPQPGSIVPPPAQGHPKTAIDNAANSESNSHNRTKKHSPVAKHAGSGLPGWLVALGTYAGLPLAGLALVAGLIIGAKAGRRRRRRIGGSPIQRLISGWREVTDHARDLGSAIPARSTRREQARALAVHDVGQLARRTDAYVFGGAAISDADAQSFWDEVVGTRHRMSSAVGRWRRIGGALNLKTLLPRIPGTAP